MTDGVVDIGYVELFSASALMFVAGLVSWKLELGQTRRIAVSSVRCFVQLLAAGFLLTYLFEFQTWWLVLLVLAAMVIAATQIATSRVKSRIPGLVPAVFVSLFVSSTAIGLIVVEGVVHAEPWYNARQLVPIVGMIMGNAMAAVAVAIDRLFADMDARAPEMFSLVALGATPHEAAAPSLKAAIGAGMTPVLANMSAAGIVTFPGMMTGQLLAGPTRWPRRSTRSWSCSCSRPPTPSPSSWQATSPTASASPPMDIIWTRACADRLYFIIGGTRKDCTVPDEKAFSHITVSTDDDDDVVIQAGARAVSRPAALEPAPEPDCAPDSEEPASAGAVADEAAPGNPSASRSDEEARSLEDDSREQRLEDLAGAPMPKAQKAVLATALLLIVGFAAYYYFFMR